MYRKLVKILEDKYSRIYQRIVAESVDAEFLAKYFKI